MIYPPVTKEEALKYRYCRWAGQPNGVIYMSRYCAYEVYDMGRGGLFHQCGRKPGHGPEQLYCKQHSKKLSRT